MSIFSQSKIKNGLSKTSKFLSTQISQIFTHKKIDATTLENLEDLLISSDIGVKTSTKIINDLKAEKFDKQISNEEIKSFLINKIEEILFPCQKTLQINDNSKPQIIVINGVNGAGKTTTIGKIAKNLTDDGKKVMIAACDTFRAAATQQLKVWAERSNCKIIESIKEGEDPASVTHRSIILAKEENCDVLLIDTAGRLQNKQNLMDELHKINRVIKKIDSSAPHENIIVLDATNGQNAKTQLEIFDKIVGISGVIMTKLDGTAKGGILVAIANEFKKPIYAIGIGEKIEDLQEFSAKNFAENLLRTSNQ